jgi:hypothetical protein
MVRFPLAAVAACRETQGERRPHCVMLTRRLLLLGATRPMGPSAASSAAWPARRPLTVSIRLFSTLEEKPAFWWENPFLLSTDPESAAGRRAVVVKKLGGEW